MLEETKGEGEGHHTYLTTVSSQICPIQHLHKYPILRPNADGILFKKQKLYLTNLFECWAWTSKSITHSFRTGTVSFACSRGMSRKDN